MTARRTPAARRCLAMYARLDEISERNPHMELPR